MTLTHRLTFERDGPKVMTVTDSNLPYKFEPTMRVILHESSGMLVRVESDGTLSMYTGERYIHTASPDAIADIDHPGTRGLLLAQYREASGHGIAAAVCRDGWWCVDTDPGGGDSNEVVGEGESEGAAILDALTRLAASKAEAAVEDAAGLVRVTDTPADVRLDRIESMLMTLADRMTRLEEWTAAP